LWTRVAEVAPEEPIVADRDRMRLGALPTATGGIARLACAHALRAGIDVVPLLASAGLTERQIKDHAARLNVHHQIKFLSFVADAVGDALFGFHLAVAMDLRELGLIYYVPASSETLGDALRRTARYSSMVNEGLALTYNDGRGARVAVDYVGVARHADRHQMEFVVSALVRLCRHLTGLRLAPSVRLTHRRREDCAELAAFFGGEVGFGAAHDEVAFDATAADLRVVSADPYLNELLVANCEEALARRRAARGSVRTAVENAIVPLLPHGRARADEVAGRLGLSQRSLARRLAQEGLTFSGVVEDLRRDLAKQYLANPGLSVSEVAWLLGYREVSAFTHAFKRWTGTTPRQARASNGA